jgi:putative hydrolase of the HAD superfamily
MIKALTIDLWETLIEDVNSSEKLRDEKRAEFIIKHLHLNENAKEKIMNFFTDLTDAFKHPNSENAWSILPETQVKKLLKDYLHIEASESDIRQIVEFYVSVILEDPPILTEKIVPKVLLELSKKYTLMMISNTGRTPGSILLNILEMYGIRDYFKYFVFSDEVMARKPDPRIFAFAQNQLGMDKKEIVHIGDSVNLDFLGATQFGFNAVLYAKGRDEVPVSPYIKSFEELEGLLNEKFSRD